MKFNGTESRHGKGFDLPEIISLVFTVEHRGQLDLLHPCGGESNCYIWGVEVGCIERLRVFLQILQTNLKCDAKIRLRNRHGSGNLQTI